ncbi:putative lipoprotein [Leptospira interrogans serovar Australis str. 200703203]|uniref:Putative lipoprotein n=1 Tax=Leptospira interrogans serovar Australis str. 200703203 TaxID=1085541 RepID=N1UHY3_LEPIR|nr:putative lipoprotein [Leptospira interrogans serovar Australis str. 200703203]
MKKDYKSMFVVISIVAFALTGCKKTPEELAKEDDLKKRQAISVNINSVYMTFVNDLTFLLDGNAQSLKEERACFEFKPKEGKASVKFYQHPTVYNLEVKTKNELEYILIYKGKIAEMKLNLKGQLPREKPGTVDVLRAEMNIMIPSSNLHSGFVNEVNVSYKDLGDRREDSTHGRFLTLEECEERYTRDDEIGSQKSTCEGPGCY